MQIMLALIGWLIGIISVTLNLILLRIRRSARALTFGRMQNGVSVIRRELIRMDYAPDIIVAINKGGCVVGDLLAIDMDKPMICLMIERRETDGVKIRAVLNDELGIPLPDLTSKKVLIVDDFEGTCTTLCEARKYLQGKNAAEIRTALLWSCLPTANRRIDPDIIAFDVQAEPLMVPWGKIPTR